MMMMMMMMMMRKFVFYIHPPPLYVVQHIYDTQLLIKRAAAKAFEGKEDEEIWFGLEQEFLLYSISINALLSRLATRRCS